MVTILTASTEYMTRPVDETFPTLGDMLVGARDDRDRSKVASYNLRDLSVIPSQTGVLLQSPKGTATVSHWAFSQLARTVSAPAGYLRTLPAPIVADALTHGMHEAAAAGETVSLLVKRVDGQPHIRALNSDTYGRVWDANLYESADDLIFSARPSQGDSWISPPTWTGKPAGTWRGDRTSFVIRVDGGSIVTDPTLRVDQQGNSQMYRGVMIRNSEVGAASLTIECVLFCYICGNLMIWGAVIDSSFRRRHVGQHAMRDTLRELSRIARKWTARGASQDEAIIRQLAAHEIAQSDKGVVDELKRLGYTAEQAAAAMLACERDFGASPRSSWGVAQGTTAIAQLETYQDDRHELDKLAALVMSRGLARVAA